MTTQNTTKLIQDYYSSFDAKDFDRLKNLVTDNIEFQFVSSDFKKEKGKDSFIKMMRECFVGFPDWKNKIDNTILSEDGAVVEGTGKGTHRGTLAFPNWSIPATGKSVTVNFCDIFKFENGKIASVHTYADNLGFLHDLGLDVRPEKKAA